MSGLLLRQRVTYDDAERYARRLGYEGEAFIQFVDLVRVVDVFAWAEDFKRQVEALKKPKKPEDTIPTG